MIRVAQILTSLILATASIAHADVLDNTRYTMRVLDKIALAANCMLVKPAVLVGRTGSVAHFDYRRKLIVVDSVILNRIRSEGSRAEVLLSVIIGHEYAHYARGHDFDYTFQHSFGRLPSISRVNTESSKTLSGKQAETEADYYGLFYALLAGYDVTLSDLSRLHSIFKERYGDYDPSEAMAASEHPTDEERIAIATDVFRELQDLVNVHRIANVALLSGQYLQAAVLYEFVGGLVNAPSVLWNELLSRYLLLQELTARELIPPDIIRNQYVATFAYRSVDVVRQLDLEQLRYRIASLIELLRLSRFDEEGVGNIEQLVTLSNDIVPCTTCTSEQLCDSHARRVENLKVAIQGRRDRTMSAGASSPLALSEEDRYRLLQTSEVLDSIIEKQEPRVLRLSVGDAKLLTVHRNGSVLLRLTYRAPRQPSLYRYDMELSECADCTDYRLSQTDNIIEQRYGGKVLRSAFIAD